MIIRVTKEDIRNGLTCGTSCPVALAIMRHTGFPVRVEANTIDFVDEIYWALGHGWCRSPKSVIKFVDDFDYHQQSGRDNMPKPFTFELSDKVLNKIARKYV